MKKIGLIILFFVTVLQVVPQSQQVSFTLEDRDRIMRTEEKLEAFKNEMNIKLESQRNEMNTRFESIDSKIETLYWGFGILIALMLFLFGYIVWDRRTALNPIQNKTLSLEERLSKIEFITREQAKNDPVFSQILRNAGLL